MNKIVCNKIDNLPTVTDLSEFFSSKQDVSFVFGLPLSTSIDNCNFVNTVPHVPDEYKRKALAIMVPDVWTKGSIWNKIHTNRFQPIVLNNLHNAHIFGGRIENRDSVYHDSGQLLLTGNYSILNASLGVLDGSNTLPRNLINNENGEYFLSSEALESPTILYGDYYFIGSIHHHFGHFLVEGLSRLWALKYIPDHIKTKLKYIIYEDSIKPYALSLLEKFGINLSNIVFSPKHAILQRIFVPDISYKTHHWGSEYQAEVYDTLMDLAENCKDNKNYVYLSRANVPDRPLTNEHELEHKLKGIGFDIISPEKIGIEQQLSIMKSAKIIVGPVGSQMYLSAFSAQSTNVVICAPPNFYLPDDLLISSMKKLNLNVFFGTSIDFDKPKRHRAWEINTEEFLEFIHSLIKLEQ
ncbi:glycosyltransferase family 61 protein [Leclercia adecarboxylata]|uniref:glycosyltransferase family 61 protein n=1 Tax=Leclercia adecarboxylata TaxID=83655 RepID=UPI00202AA719|nr:glycosyltransferase 61 family protein [Leclercia adecarboxylata]URN99823.1 glycosyltransferase family 61 protein [Leclercia adecarboxylata]